MCDFISPFLDCSFVMILLGHYYARLNAFKLYCWTFCKFLNWKKWVIYVWLGYNDRWVIYFKISYTYMIIFYGIICKYFEIKKVFNLPKTLLLSAFFSLFGDFFLVINTNVLFYFQLKRKWILPPWRTQSSWC